MLAGTYSMLAALPIVERDVGRVMLVRLVQASKAPSPIETTFVGISMLDNLGQL